MGKLEVVRNHVTVLLTKHRIRWTARLRRRKTLARLFVLALAFLTSALLVHVYDAELLERLSSKEGYATLTNLLVGIGCAMVGATAIVFTLVQFATQTNVARMPTELFRLFSSDVTLLGAFLGTMALAIAIAASPLIASPELAVWQLFLAAWAVITIVLTFVLAYERALNLINPSVQARVAGDKAKKSLARWGMVANRMLTNAETSPSLQFDVSRRAFFATNPGWEGEAQSILGQLVPYGAKLAEQGDHDSFGPILAATVDVHRAYVRARGRTFIENGFLAELAESREPFQIATLEDLRRAGLAALAKRDERQLTFIYRALQSLFLVYIDIEYARSYDTKSHAALVAQYLYALVQESATHKMPDVTMEGGRLVGLVARANLKNGLTVDFHTAVQALGRLGVAGTTSREMLPVAMVVEEALRDSVMLGLMTSQQMVIEFERIHQVAVEVATVVMLKAPEATSLEGIHRAHLGGYFSVSNSESLLPRIEQMMELEEADVGSFALPSVTRLLEWVDAARHPTKDLMLVALEMKSSLCFDLLSWPIELTVLLLRLSGRAQTPGVEAALLDMANSTLAVLTWLPEAEDSVFTAEAHGHLERLTRVAAVAGRAGAHKVHSSAIEQMWDWGFKLTKTKVGWDGLRRVLAGLVALELTFGGSDMSALEIRINGEITKRGGIPFDAKRLIANGLAKVAKELRGRRYVSAVYESLLKDAEESEAEAALNQIANSLLIR
ncbi:hypothetical protein ACF8O9_08055 [Stenotrophomonas geniculata]|uniref:hypothetical protein n=1 Tax=Stenotrophomonas geniculata TaxID=86188 RepID=UPI00370B4D35